MRRSDLYNGGARPASWLMEADTLPLPGRFGSPDARSSPRPSPATSRLKSKRLRFLVEPGSPHKTTVRLDGLARICTCISRSGISDVGPASYWVMIRDGGARTWTRCPTDRPVQVNLPEACSFDMTVGPDEGVFDPYYVEAVILYS